MPTIYVAGYGDDMSTKGLQRHLPGKKIAGRVTVKGWRRRLSHFGITHRYLTLVPDETAEATHVALIAETPEELEVHRGHERGFELVDITRHVDPLPQGEDVIVYTFVSIPPERKTRVRRSYLSLVLGDLTPQQQEEVLREIDFCGATVDEDG